MYEMNTHKHLKRLPGVWESHPRYFVTVCVNDRQKILTVPAAHEMLRKHWDKSLDLYGWAVGSYMIMPDHVHFFCTDASGATTLSRTIGAWKQWSAKELTALLGVSTPVWQKEFFDHLLRSNESYSEKWNYVRQNPVRAGLVANADQWPYKGHIHYL
jgi:REP element-mobilizing transposase RayT